MFGLTSDVAILRNAETEAANQLCGTPDIVLPLEV